MYFKKTENRLLISKFQTMVFFYFKFSLIQAFLAQNYLFIYFWLSAQNYCHINLSDRNLGSALHLNLNLKFYFIIYFLKKVDKKKKKKKTVTPSP